AKGRNLRQVATARDRLRGIAVPGERARCLRGRLEEGQGEELDAGLLAGRRQRISRPRLEVRGVDPGRQRRRSGRAAGPDREASGDKKGREEERQPRSSHGWGLPGVSATTRVG